GGQIGTFAINFSRPAGQVIAQYYEFLRLGREGYTKVQNASYQVAAYLADEIAKLGPYEFICTGRPDEGIPAVCFKLKEGEDPGYTLYDRSERLRLRGWQVPAFPCTTSLNVCVCAAGRFRPSLSAVKPP
ncbi:pyridoxal-dependent decarboxylase, partial [Escherichia coli]|uniref:pyridoxal-dependent decarboxylase n=1 Tax=Escherichia coli TaxID=562 RepID=UPI003F5179BA